MKTNMYLFYLKRNNICVLYAYTDNKSYRDRFKSQRDMNAFSYIKKKMNDDDLKSFEKFNKLSKMTEIILEDGSDTFSVIGTIQEENELSYVCARIHSKLEFIRGLLDERVNEYYASIVHQLIQATKIKCDEDNDKKELILNLNTYHLFYTCYDFTFNSNVIYHDLDTTIRNLKLIN